MMRSSKLFSGPRLLLSLALLAMMALTTPACSDSDPDPPRADAGLGADQGVGPDGSVPDQALGDAGPSPDGAAGDGGTPADMISAPDINTGAPKLNQVFSALTFTQPLAIMHAGDNSGRLFVVEQGGKIKVFSSAGNPGSAKVFLDISGKVDTKGWEEGLLGLAFHPKYTTNGTFYVNYTASGPDRTVIARFKVSAGDPDKADPSSETVLLTISQPYDNHNGGDLRFGPDGYLYIAVGDGGDGGDPKGHGQNRQTLLGNILRIDVDQSAGGKPYAIPADNPLKGNSQGFREEIYAWGLRNPWRITFDSQTGKLWAADVGQDDWEEVNIIEKGKNYGWNVMEGKHCFKPPQGCNQSGLELPIHEYTLSGGQSITGGHVYRGVRVASLNGAYVFADFISGDVYRLDYNAQTGAATAQVLFKTGEGISSFGLDPQGEIYLTSFAGKVYKIQ